MALQTVPGGTWVSGCFRGEPGDGKVVEVMSGRHPFRTANFLVAAPGRGGNARPILRNSDWVAGKQR